MQRKRSIFQVIRSPKSPRIDLPENIIHAILVNLPPNQVFRLKSVSKQWNSIISSPFFFQAYTATKQHPALPWTLLMKRSFDHPMNVNSIKTFLSSSCPDYKHPLFSCCDYTLPSCERHRYSYNVVSSSDGLLLCRSNGPRYAICSPLTRQWFVLPFHKLRDHGRIQCNKEALVTKIEAGSVTNLVTFKVIRMQTLYCADKTVLNMEIYDSVTDEWIESELDLQQKLIHRDRAPVCLNGSVHWEFRPHVLIAYNPTDNHWRSLHCPIWGRSSFVAPMLGICDRKLQYCEMDNGADALEVWVLEDYDEGLWALKHKVTWNDIIPAPVEIVTKRFCSGFTPIAFHPLDSNIIYMIDDYEKRLRWYDFEEMKLLDLHMVPSVDRLSDVLSFVLPLWPPVLVVAKKAQSRLKAMENMHNSGSEKTCLAPLEQRDLTFSTASSSTFAKK